MTVILTNDFIQLPSGSSVLLTPANAASLGKITTNGDVTIK